MNNIIGRHEPPKVALNHAVSLNSINYSFCTVAITPCIVKPIILLFHLILMGFNLIVFQNQLMVPPHLTKLDLRSTGPNDLSAYFLKEVSSFTVSQLNELYNDFLEKSIIPSV